MIMLINKFQYFTVIAVLCCFQSNSCMDPMQIDQAPAAKCSSLIKDAQSLSIDKLMKKLLAGSTTLTQKMKKDSGISHELVLSSNNRYIVSMGIFGGFNVWDARNCKLLHHIEGIGSVYSEIIFSPDSKLFAAMDVDGIFAVYDIASGAMLAKFDRHDDQSRYEVQGGYGICFSSDSSRLISFRKRRRYKPFKAQRVIELWDIRSMRRVNEIEVQGDPNSPTPMCLSPDGNTLAIPVTGTVVIGSSFKYPTRIELFDVNNLSRKGVLTGHSRLVLQLAFSPDGKCLASASSDHTVGLWDIENKNFIACLEGPTNEVTAVAFSPDGKQLVCADFDGNVCFFDVAQKKLVARKKKHYQACGQISYSCQKQLLVSSDCNGSYCLWTPETCAFIKSLYLPNGRTGKFCLSADGSYVFAMSTRGEILRFDISEILDLRSILKLIDASQLSFVKNLVLDSDQGKVVNFNEDKAKYAALRSLCPVLQQRILESCMVEMPSSIGLTIQTNDNHTYHIPAIKKFLSLSTVLDNAVGDVSRGAIKHELASSEVSSAQWELLRPFVLKLSLGNRSYTHKAELIKAMKNTNVEQLQELKDVSEKLKIPFLGDAIKLVLNNRGRGQADLSNVRPACVLL